MLTLPAPPASFVKYLTSQRFRNFSMTNFSRLTTFSVHITHQVSLFHNSGRYCVYIIYEPSFWFWSAWQLPVKLAGLVYWRHKRPIVRLYMPSRVCCSSCLPWCPVESCYASLKCEKTNQVRRFSAFPLFAHQLSLQTTWLCDNCGCHRLMGNEN